MRILDRFIARSIFVWSFVALVVLESIRLFGAFVDDSGDIGIGDFSVLNALQVTLLRAPGFAVEVFPVAALLGGLLALGMMTRNAELMAIRASGVSTWRLVGSVLRAGIGMVIILVAISELVAPATEHRAESLRSEMMNQPSIARTRHGYWIRDGSSFVNIRSIQSTTSLNNIHVYELDDQWRLRTVSYAKQGEFKDNHWVFEQGVRTTIDGERVTTKPLKQWVSDLQLKPRFLDLAAIKPTVMPAWDLYEYVRFLNENEQSQPEYEIALWSKVTTPVTTLILLVSAFAFVAGNPRSFDIGKRILAGAVIGSVFVLMNRGVSFLSVAFPEFPPLLAAWLPGVIILGITLLFLRRA